MQTRCSAVIAGVVASAMALGLVACGALEGAGGSQETPDLVGGLAVSDVVVEGEVVRVVPGTGDHPDRVVLSDISVLWDGEQTVDGDGNKVDLPDVPAELRTVQNLQDVPESTVGSRMLAAVGYAGQAAGGRWRSWQVEFSLDSETMEPHGGAAFAASQLRRAYADDEDTVAEKQAAFIELTAEAAGELRARNLGEPKPAEAPRLARVRGGQ